MNTLSSSSAPRQVHLDSNRHLKPKSDSRALEDVGSQFKKVSAEMAELSSAFGAARAPAAKDKIFERSDDEIAQRVKKHLATRRRRAQFFEADLFADPAWDILLDLFLAELEQRRVMISSVCAAACVPSTTALRWIKILADQGLVSRTPDFMDGRRFYLALSPIASGSMRSYFAVPAPLASVEKAVSR